jgi:hypothetical protein
MLKLSFIEKKEIIRSSPPFPDKVPASTEKREEKQPDF